MTSLSVGSLVPIEPVTVTTSVLPDAEVGTSYGPVTLQIANALPPYTVVVTFGSPPQGISMSSSGSLSGVASQQGSSSFEVTVGMPQ